MRAHMNIIHSLVEMMLAVVRADDPVIYARLRRLSVPPFFSVSWILTWFAHDLSSIFTLEQLFDFFIASHPSAIVYAAAAVSGSLETTSIVDPDNVSQGAAQHGRGRSFCPSAAQGPPAKSRPAQTRQSDGSSDARASGTLAAI